MMLSPGLSDTDWPDVNTTQLWPSLATRYYAAVEGQWPHLPCSQPQFWAWVCPWSTFYISLLSTHTHQHIYNSFNRLCFCHSVWTNYSPRIVKTSMKLNHSTAYGI